MARTLLLCRRVTILLRRVAVPIILQLPASLILSILLMLATAPIRLRLGPGKIRLRVVIMLIPSRQAQALMKFMPGMGPTRSRPVRAMTLSTQALMSIRFQQVLATTKSISMAALIRFLQGQATTLSLLNTASRLRLSVSTPSRVMLIPDTLEMFLGLAPLPFWESRTFTSLRVILTT